MMLQVGTKLLELYTPLVGGVFLGWVLTAILPKSAPAYLGRFLFWIGVPISIVGFLRRANLSGPIWIAAVVAWAAILLGAGLAWGCLKIEARRQQSLQLDAQNRNKIKQFTLFPVAPIHPSSQGSFLLASMFGNTGYLGYPVILTLVGPQYFGWALFYDLLGTTLGAYGLGVALAARFGTNTQNPWQVASAIAINPALWSFGFGLAFRNVPLPGLVEQSLQVSAWTIVALSLVLIGMRLSQLSTGRRLQQAYVTLVIKMLLVPLILGSSLPLLGITGLPQQAIALQMAMPPAFATLILAEAYDLDRDLAVTALALGSISLLFTLPIWLWLFGGSS